MFLEFKRKQRSIQPLNTDERVAINTKAIAYVLPLKGEGTCIVLMAAHPEDPSVLVQESYDYVLDRLFVDADESS